MVEALEALTEPVRPSSDKPLRYTVHNVLKVPGAGTVVRGKVVAGTLKAGMSLYCANSNLKTEAKSL
jgi:translation elongation factor EF-1alpha